MTGRRVAGLCALLAAALAILAASSYVTAICVTLLEDDHDVVLMHFYDGRSRMFWFHSPVDPIETESDYWSGEIHVNSQQRRLPDLPEKEFGTPPPVSFAVPIRILNRAQGPSLGGRWRGEIGNRAPPPWQQLAALWSFDSSFIRVPTWPMVLLLMIPPIRRSIAERRRLRRAARNECLACGYNLTALIEPRCPECGTRIIGPTVAEQSRTSVGSECPVNSCPRKPDLT